MLKSYLPASALLAAAKDACESADNAGCDDDLTVASHQAMETLREAIERAEASMRLADAHAEQVQAARDAYAGDDLEIDACPAVSVADGAVWVSAWIRVVAPGASDEC